MPTYTVPDSTADVEAAALIEAADQIDGLT
jgi:hypothetical protein